MRLFLDTEFTDSLSQKLISIGLVSDDGREFYVEISDGWLEQDCSDFVREIVLPLLDNNATSTWDEANAGLRLIEWLASFNEPLTVVYDMEVDWKLMTRLLWPHPNEHLLLEGCLLGWTSFEDARQHEALLKALLQAEPKHHHALVDARALKNSVLRIEQQATGKSQSASSST